MPNGSRLLDRLGLYKTAIQKGNTQSKITMHSFNGKVLGTTDMDGAAKTQTGYGYIRIKREDLMSVMLPAVRDEGIPIHYSKSIVAIDQKANDKVTATFADGTEASATYLFGCDGIHSQVRQLYVDPDQKPSYSGLSGMFSIIEASELEVASNVQIDGMHTTLTKEGMFMATPCTAASSQMYWGFQQEVPIPEEGDTRDGWELHGKEHVDLLKQTMRDVLKETNGAWGTTMRELVDKTSVMNFYPVYRLPSGGKWHKGSVMLTGDAGHAMQPHAGQGVSMALEDAFLLGRLLKNPDTPADEVFSKFDQIRRPRIDTIAGLASGRGKERLKASEWGHWLKECVMQVFLMAAPLLPTQQMQKLALYDIDEVKV